MFLNFKSLKIKNFLAYKDFYLDLTDKGYCFVWGENKFKADNALSNGSGKSTFLQALCWCITGETLSGTKTDVKNIYVDEDEVYVELNVDIDDKNYKIIRYNQPRSDLKIIINDEDKSGKGVRESEKILNELLPDLTKDLISNIIVLGQGLPNKFTSHSPVGRKELLEKLSKSDFMIEDIKNKILNREEFLIKEKRIAEDKLLEIKTKIDLINKQKESLQESLNSFNKLDYDNEIKKVEVIKLENINNLSTLEAEIQFFQNEFDRINNNIKELDLKKEDSLRELFMSYSEAIQTVIASLSSEKSKYAQILKEIQNLESIKDICPTCGQKLPGIIKPDTTKQKEEASKSYEIILNLENKEKSIKDKHKYFTEEINNEYIKNSKDIKIEQSRIKDKLNELIKLIDEKNKLILKCESDLDKLNYHKENDLKIYNESQEKLKNCITDIELLNTESIDIEKKLNELNSRLTVIKKINTFVKRDFRGYLLRDVIEYLNSKIKEYSLIIFNHNNIELMLEGTNLNIYFNNKLCEYLSGGERQKIDLIIQLAIREMLVNYMDFHSSILCLDEITDNLDELGCNKVFDLLSNELPDLSSIFIISHHDRELNIPIDTEIHIIKDEDGISRISEGI